MRLKRYWLGVSLSTLVWAAWLTGCAFRGEGLVEATGSGAHLQVSTGPRWKLIYGSENRVLSHLDGHIVLIEGSRMFKNLTVKSFRIPSGTHGMPVWFGTLERRGVQLGLSDRNNGGYYLLDGRATQTLMDHEGADVLVEGYVDGPHRIRVMHHTLLR